MAVLKDPQSYFEKMDDGLMDSWAALLEARTGMHLPQERRSFLTTSLALRMKEIGMQSFADYFHLLKSEKKNGHEWLTLVDRLTIHETRFFRHQPSLELLEQVILPELFASEADKKKLQIWSAGCSTGEEVYTLCMIADQFFEKMSCSNCYLAVTGMDISIPSLKHAKEAIYNSNNMHHVPDHYLDNYFLQRDDSHFQVIHALRKRVCFVPFNIVDLKKTILESMDIIFCQNVLIYFTREKREKIIDQLVDYLKPGGYLVLGAGEILKVPEHLEKIEFLNALAFIKKK